MKNFVLLVTAVIVLGLFNFAIYQKENIIDNGQPILLKLAPVDPRSLMQGDYMQFRYAIEDEMRDVNKEVLKKHRFAVIKPDANNIAHFVRVYNNEKLASDEKLVKYRYRILSFRDIEIKPDTFFFQEGLAPLYQKSAYAIFHYNGSKDYLLTGVADSNLNQINPSVNE